MGGARACLPLPLNQPVGRSCSGHSAQRYSFPDCLLPLNAYDTESFLLKTTQLIITLPCWIASLLGTVSDGGSECQNKGNAAVGRGSGLVNGWLKHRPELGVA